MKQLLIAVVAIVVMALLLRQCRKPTGLAGRLFLAMMNLNHANVTNWGLQHVEIGKRLTILDVGCGGGKTIRKIAKIASEGRVLGVDYATASIATSRSANRPEIERGRVAICHATVSQLPFHDNSFDLVTAVETFYYWPDRVADLREVKRVLKPGGTLVIIAETYKRSRIDFASSLIMKMIRATYLTISEHQALFEAAGYTDIEILEEPRKGWLCTIGKRPALT
jgi:ubiquinone/menaquinone biosynthesis C-methylase UbiE